jgi:hypothetical protein
VTETTALQAPVNLTTPFTVPKTKGKEFHDQATALVQRAEATRELGLQWQDHANQLKKKNVATLGRDEVFMVRDGEQKMRCVKTKVVLTVEEGHVYHVQGKFMITANGYTRLNQIAGVTLVQPETIEIDGKIHENPWLECDARKPGVLVRVHCRVLSVGRSATGQPVAIDYRLKFDPNLYLLQALKKTQRYWKQGNCPVQDLTEREFFEEWTAEERRGWAFLPLSAIGDDYVGIAFHLGNQEVRKKMGDQVDLVTFAERRAQTMCRRNAMRHHPSIGVTQVALNDIGWDGKTLARGWAEVPVFAWTPDNRSLAETTELILAGTQGRADAVTAAGRTTPGAVEVIEESADPDEEVGAAEEIVEGETVTDDGEVEQRSPGDSPDPSADGQQEAIEF